MMARMVQVSPIYERFRKIYAYANTGKEMNETIEFLSRCGREWGIAIVIVEAVISQAKGVGTRHRVVAWKDAIRNTDPMIEGHPFFDMCRKYGIPSNTAPHCTRELKANAIKSYLKSAGVKECIQAWGIRADEPSRLTPRDGVIYPLADAGITEEIVRKWWDRQSFDLQLKDYQNNCDLCFKKSKRKKITIIKENPSIVPDWKMLEAKFATKNGRRVVFDREGLSIVDLETLSSDPLLISAVDKHDARLAEESVNPQLFDMLSGVDLDFETHCHCRST